jgi:rifampin ADP-ribosylating transferase
LLLETESRMTNRFFHGTRAELTRGDLIAPAPLTIAHVFLSLTLDEAIWSAELADGDSAPRVYFVEPLGPVERAADQAGYHPPGHPSMSWCSRAPLRVTGEVTEWLHYHGTRAALRPGDLLKPGYLSNFGATARTANYIYFTRTLDAAAWGAELAAGEGRGRIYGVEPTGPLEDDPNLTNKRFRGNPTKSFRSREALRITGEIVNWQGHTPDAIKSMKDGLGRLKQRGVEAIDDCVGQYSFLNAK